MDHALRKSVMDIRSFLIPDDKRTHWGNTTSDTVSGALLYHSTKQNGVWIPNEVVIHKESMDHPNYAIKRHDNGGLSSHSAIWLVGADDTMQYDTYELYLHGTSIYTRGEQQSFIPCKHARIRKAKRSDDYSYVLDLVFPYTGDKETLTPEDFDRTYDYRFMINSAWALKIDRILCDNILFTRYTSINYGSENDRANAIPYHGNIVDLFCMNQLDGVLTGGNYEKLSSLTTSGNIVYLPDSDDFPVEFGKSFDLKISGAGSNHVSMSNFQPDINYKANNGSIAQYHYHTFRGRVFGDLLKPEKLDALADFVISDFRDNLGASLLNPYPKSVMDMFGKTV